MPLTHDQRLTRALTALRLAAERGRGDQRVSVRRWHLRVLIEAWDKLDAGPFAGVNREPVITLASTPEGHGGPRQAVAEGERYLAEHAERHR